MLHIIFLHILLILSIALIIVLSYKLVIYLNKNIKILIDSISSAKKSKQNLLNKYSNN
jgi:hypothetical protein